MMCEIQQGVPGQGSLIPLNCVHFCETPPPSPPRRCAHHDTREHSAELEPLGRLYVHFVTRILGRKILVAHSRYPGCFLGLSEHVAVEVYSILGGDAQEELTHRRRSARSWLCSSHRACVGSLSRIVPSHRQAYTKNTDTRT